MHKTKHSANHEQVIYRLDQSEFNMVLYLQYLPSASSVHRSHHPNNGSEGVTTELNIK